MSSSQGTATPQPSLVGSSITEAQLNLPNFEKRSEDRQTRSESSQRAEAPSHPSASVSIEVNIGNEYAGSGRRDSKQSPPPDRPHDMQYAPINYSPVNGQTCRYTLQTLPQSWLDALTCRQ